MTSERMVRLSIKRQANPDSRPYVEEFAIPYRPNMNVTGALMEIRKNPVNAKGEKVEPVVWESVCLEEVCGSCSMLINGKPRQACSSLIDQLEQPIRLAPLSSFPIVRDLMVDREVLTVRYCPSRSTMHKSPAPSASRSMTIEPRKSC